MERRPCTGSFVIWIAQPSSLSRVSSNSFSPLFNTGTTFLNKIFLFESGCSHSNGPNKFKYVRTEDMTVGGAPLRRTAQTDSQNRSPLPQYPQRSHALHRKRAPGNGVPSLGRRLATSSVGRYAVTTHNTSPGRRQRVHVDDILKKNNQKTTLAVFSLSLHTEKCI